MELFAALSRLDPLLQFGRLVLSHFFFNFQFLGGWFFHILSIFNAFSCDFLGKRAEDINKQHLEEADIQ